MNGCLYLGQRHYWRGASLVPGGGIGHVSGQKAKKRKKSTTKALPTTTTMMMRRRITHSWLVNTWWTLDYRQTVSLTRTSPRTAKVKITTIRTTDPWLEMPWCQPDHLPRLQINLPRLVGAEHVQGFRDVVLTFFFVKNLNLKCVFITFYNILIHLHPWPSRHCRQRQELKSWRKT